MKQIILTIVISLSACGLHAQNDSIRKEKKAHDFYQHELKLSFGDAVLASLFWTQSMNDHLYCNASLSYFYRPVKWFWVGVNFVNYYGTLIYATREYSPNGAYQDIEKSTIRYCGVIAPEVRFSHLNQRNIIVYSALSGGFGWQNGSFRHTADPHPNRVGYLHLTAIGVSGNFGEDKNILFGGELGIGSKGFINIYIGYRF